MKACRLERYNDCICAHGLPLNTSEDRVLDLVDGGFALGRTGNRLDETLTEQVSHYILHQQDPDNALVLTSFSNTHLLRTRSSFRQW